MILEYFEVTGNTEDWFKSLTKWIWKEEKIELIQFEFTSNHKIIVSMKSLVIRSSTSPRIICKLDHVWNEKEAKIS